jgi:2-aminoethylphosphonate-pyruvate transaminase
MENKHYLFCPGPVTLSEAVQQSLPHPDMCHRVPEFEKIMTSIQQNLLKIFKANEKYTVLLITGSGTAANETVISSNYSEDDHVLLINNGEFGCRLEELLEVHGVKATVLNYEWGRLPNLEEIESRIKSNPGITGIAMVYHETSSGLINPVTQIGNLAKKYGKNYFVDGVSAVGGEDVNVVRDNIDLCTTSSNKCLASYPGVGIICVKKSRIEVIKNYKIQVAYLNLPRLYEYSEKYHQTPNTPSVTAFVALEAAVRRIHEEGLQNQIDRHKRCAKVIRDGVRKMGLRILVDEKYAANMVTSVFLPEHVELDSFIQKLEVKGYTVYSGKRHLKEQKMFQIANMGAITEEHCEGFLNTVAETLKEY